jgi:hypothetical protein
MVSSVQAPDEKWSDVFERVKDCVLLVGVEEPKGRASWPFATCCAIRNDTLLCSGQVGQELAEFRRSGWKVWAGLPWQDRRAEVLTIRVHKLFQATRHEPLKCAYFNTALLTTPPTLPHVADLATPQDLEQVDAGLPMACVAMRHDGEAVNRFQSLVPEIISARVFLVTTLPPAPGGPRLLHLQMSAPERIYGSPLFNARGRLVGVYGEPAKLEAGQSLKIHYATVVEPELINIRWHATSDTTWVDPLAAATGTSNAKK